MWKCQHKKKHFLGRCQNSGQQEVLYSCPICGMIVAESLAKIGVYPTEHLQKVPA